ncbi:MAG: putative epimerase, PhzC/PhzF [Microbacterium sp.]|nr:putative epimerase, PhzC/PhzF [Microbacterium sp.]
MRPWPRPRTGAPYCSCVTDTYDHRPAARAGRVFAWCAAAALVLGLFATLWVGVRGGLAVTHLTAAQRAVQDAASDIDDPPTLAPVLSTVREETSAARELTSDPIWSLAETLPWIGPQLSALAVTSATLDDAVSDGLGPLATAASGLSDEALRPKDGAFDIEVISALEPVAGTASAQLHTATAELSAIDTRSLLGPLRDGVTRARDLVDTAANSADALHRAARLIPTMLGADGPRSYLVLFQNNAEWRSLGGIVGALAQIDTDGGRIELVDQASAADFPPGAEQPVVDLPAEVRDLYDTRPARFIQNVTQIPDFTVGAPIAREMWRRLRGRDVDGVIALDPVTLGYMLTATGPVTLPTGDELTADNAVPLLLQEVYRRYPDPAQQDAFFRAASAAVFAALAEGRADPRELVDALSRAASEDRLLLWNADADDQAVLDDTTLQGTLPTTDATRTTFGVYLDDGTGSKMDFYLHPTVDVAWCGPDSAALSVTLRNDAPDPGTLSPYVTGEGAYGVPVGEALTGVYVYLPAGARLEERTSTTEGVAAGFAGGAEQGRQVVKWSVQLAPGQQAHLDLRVSTPRTTRIDARVTPTIGSPAIGNVVEGCVAAG